MEPLVRRGPEQRECHTPDEDDDDIVSKGRSGYEFAFKGVAHRLDVLRVKCPADAPHRVHLVLPYLGSVQSHPSLSFRTNNRLPPTTGRTERTQVRGWITSVPPRDRNRTVVPPV